MDARIPGDDERQYGNRGGLGRRDRQLGFVRQRLLRSAHGRRAERELCLAPQGRDTPGVGVLRGEVIVRRDRLVVAPRLLLTRADDERREHVVRLERCCRARHYNSCVAALGGGEGGSEPELDRGIAWLLACLGEEPRDLGGGDGGRLGSARAGDGRTHHDDCDRTSHRRDFFFAGFFLARARGRAAARAGFGLDLRGPSMSPRTRSPSSGPIRPRRTA